MSNYTLKATHKDSVSIADITAEDSMDATMQAIAMVLDRAMFDETWERGRVTLTDSDGNVLHTMEAKG